jgi:hypothetical protein
MLHRSRVLTPEILDSLDPADPHAVRSRRDLRLINGFLGNSRWILRELRKHSTLHEGIEEGIVELGAGDGALCSTVHRSLPRTPVIGLDLVPRPSGLPSEIQWVRGDFFETLPQVQGSVCIGSLILHHFSSEMLHSLGEGLQRFSLLVFCEPLRGSLPLTLARLAWPFSGDVTRHDMPASIRAGFRIGELPGMLGLDPTAWHIRESLVSRGSLRMIASRH